MSTLVVGLTVISFATSAPELAVTLGAVFSDSSSLAVGNVVGSNIANILLVIGISAAIMPLAVKSQVVRTDIPVMIGMSVAFLVVVRDGKLSRADGLLLIAMLVTYLSVTLITSRRHRARTTRDVADSRRTVQRQRSPAVDVFLILAGVVLLVVGAQLLVRGATDIAAWLGVADLIVGLTIVAIGTSLPEMATSIIAVIKGERDLAVGNVVGSNIFNIGAVMGLTGAVADDGIDVAPSAIRFDIPIMIAVALALLPIAFTGFTLSRWEGALLFAFYAAYVLYLYLEATDQPALGQYTQAMLWFVIPITAVWLLLLVVYEIRVRHDARTKDQWSAR